MRRGRCSRAPADRSSRSAGRASRSTVTAMFKTFSTSSASPNCGTRCCSPCSCWRSTASASTCRFRASTRTAFEGRWPRSRPRAATTAAAGRLANYVSLFSGGNLSQSTIFGLGIMPYISSSIIFQLLGRSCRRWKSCRRKGETGRKKIQEWTRYATVPLCIVQAVILAQLHAQHRAAAGAAAVPARARRQRSGSMGIFCAHRRLHLPDVARRADRRIRPGQRRQLDHPRRHRRPHARRDRRCSSHRRTCRPAPTPPADQHRARSCS